MRELGLSFDEDCSGCFVCGKANPSGMRLDFTVEGDRYVTEFKVDDVYQGHPGIMHGGIISAVLDEVMGRFLRVKGHPAVTAEMTVKFRRPIACGSTVRFEGEILDVRGRRIKTVARALSQDGTVLAEAAACFISKSSRGGTQIEPVRSRTSGKG